MSPILPDTLDEVLVPLSSRFLIHLGKQVAFTAGSLLVLFFLSSCAQNLFIKTETNAVGWSAENKAINDS